MPAGTSAIPRVTALDPAMLRAAARRYARSEPRRGGGGGGVRDGRRRALEPSDGADGVASVASRGSKLSLSK